MTRTINPFVVTGKIPTAYFCDRVEESKVLLNALTNQMNVVLTAERRMGKTSLVDFVFDKPEIKTEYVTIAVDILHTTTFKEFILAFGSAVFDRLATRSDKLMRLFASTLRSLSASFGYDPVQNSPTFDLKIGDIVKGVVTGVVDFGVFVNVDGIEGLVHISEISWERVNNPSDYVKVGDQIEAKIIAIDKERLSLSMKQLVEDPWISEVAGLKKGSKVEGTVTRITPFGAFVQISPAVEALVHVSELGEGSDVDPEKIFTLNERKGFKVLDIDKEGRKISLSITK